jgi:hypothetical protein
VSLSGILRDVISQRREASVFYRPRGQVESDKGHAYYISVLEWALKTLEKSNSISQPANSSEVVSGSNGRTDVGLSNLFDLLQIEGVTNGSDGEATSGSESDVVARKKFQVVKGVGKVKSKSSTEVSKQTQAPGGRKGRDPDLDFLDSIIREQVVPDKEDEEDYFFMIYCFFKDWNYLREYLQERWVCTFACVSRNSFISDPKSRLPDRPKINIPVSEVGFCSANSAKV